MVTPARMDRTRLRVDDGCRRASQIERSWARLPRCRCFEVLTACPYEAQEIAEWMTDAAPRIPTEVIVSQAAVLQVFEMVNKRGDLVAGCRVTEGALQAGATGVVAAPSCCLHSHKNGQCASAVVVGCLL